MTPFATGNRWSSLFLQFLGIVVLTGFLGACEVDNSSQPDAPDSATVQIGADSLVISKILRTDARFSTLVTSLDSTGLDSVLVSDGPYTLFAPPDTAFAVLPEGTLPLLLTERRSRLRTILSHHVVAARLDVAALSETSNLVTLSGDTLDVRSTDSTLTVGNARLLDSDIAAKNGRIHVIDEVLRPPTTESE